MPLYDYQCEACGEEFETFSTISQRDRDDVECPACGVVGSRRMVSAAALTGSVWSSGFTPPSAPVPT